ncbi:hypothetical protein A9267_14825 [Shewanella sp. UCD-FRSSP16_17]|uniref:hypothetical protein n=1 Tax=Shewanella sp. UCD-FRSSP16_17 TaxID=1853256 RepID=UPI0007EED57C|nr:hypothetical protein [Shewanella sp. UCD-FRSSP16_17]OBT07136.1 hypothetical protein A9267_14825 [Shewanella sp. UCD-FRSSP16_17]
MLIEHQTVRLQVDNVLVQYHIFDTNEPVMVTFPPNCQALTQDQVDVDKQAWSFQFFSKRKMNIIAFNHIGGDDHYFDSFIFAQFLQKLSLALQQFPKRIGYGVSKGGFATAFHADTLKLDKALLLMPVSTYWQPAAPWDPKLEKHFQLQKGNMSHLNASECKTPLTIIYDPLYKPDANHKASFKSCIASYRLPGVGHRIARALADIGLLKDIILAFREGDIDSARFYQAARKRRYLSYYFRSLDKVHIGTVSKKRLAIIYLHKFYRYKEQSIDLDKIKARLQESVCKRLDYVCCLVHGKKILAIRNVAAGSALVFC